METIYFLYALLLIILAFAVYHLTKKAEVDAEVTELAQRDDSHLLAELHSVRITVWICFIGAMLLTANYAITYFSGSSVSNIREWGLYQWSGAFIGLVVTVAISLVQKVLYASPTSHKAALLVTTLILSFVIFSEIGSPIEKEEMKMKEASRESPTYQAVIGAIGHSTASTPSAYSGQMAQAQALKAKHEFELGRCDRHKSKGAKRVQRCVDYENRKIAEAQAQAQIASFNSNMQSEAQQNQATTLSLVNEAKALENNTDHHSGLIKFVQQAFDTSFLNAMMLASLILVVAFEAGFHFAGSREGMLKAALIQRGNKDITLASEARRIKKMQDFKRQTEKHQRYLANQDEENKTTRDKDAPEVKIKQDKPSPSSSFKPATQFTSNEHTGTHEKQFDLFGAKKASANNQQVKPPEKPAPKTEKSKAELLQEIADDKATIRRLRTRPSVPPSDPSDRVSDDPSARVKTGDETSGGKSPKMDVMSASNFDNLYQHVSGKIADKSIRLSMDAMTKCVRDYVKTHEKLESTAIAIPECRYLANEIRDRMLKEGIITSNPNYKNGLPKYLVA